MRAHERRNGDLRTAGGATDSQLATTIGHLRRLLLRGAFIEGLLTSRDRLSELR